MAYKRFCKDQCDNRVFCYSYNDNDKLQDYYNHITKRTEPAYRCYLNGNLVRESYYQNSLQYNCNENEPSTIQYYEDGNINFILFTTKTGACPLSKICYVKFYEKSEGGGAVQEQEFYNSDGDYIMECFEK